MCKNSMYKNVIANIRNTLDSKVFLYDFMSLKAKQLTDIQHDLRLTKLQSCVAMVAQTKILDIALSCTLNYMMYLTVFTT